jgi:hypothetical protein
MRFLSTLSLGGILALSVPLWAELPADQPASRAGGGGKRPLDVVVALDSSGSMKKNDPQGLMSQVVSAFAERLAPDSRLGIVRFGAAAELLLPLTDSGGADFGGQVRASLQHVDYRDQWTDIGAGVERAVYELRGYGRPEADRLVVFLTDGFVDTGDRSRDMERARWLREDIAQEAKRLGVRIFGIALTEEADFELIQSVAQTTGGNYYRVLLASDIAPTFDQISTRIAELAHATKAAAAPQPVVVQFPWQLWILGAVGFVVIGAVALLAMRGPIRSRVKLLKATLYDRSGESGATQYTIKKPVTRIGREKDNDIVIAHDTVSAQHAAIEFRDGIFYLRDLRSTNGTFLNGERFSDRETISERPLKNRDRIRFDAYEFEFVVDSLEGLRRTVVGQAGPSVTLLRPQPPDVARRAPQDSAPIDVVAAGRARVPVAADEDEVRTKAKSEVYPLPPETSADGSTKECPVCATLNPTAAVRCPCGYQFSSINEEAPQAPKFARLHANKKIVEENSCPTCGGGFDLGVDLVRCEKCQAVFHVPCWEHSGRCDQPACREATQSCPFCNKTIKREAVKCRHCGRYLDATIEATVGSLDERLQMYLFKASGTTRVGMNAMIGVGIFIFGWLLPVAFSNLGRGSLGWVYFVPVLLSAGLFRAGEPALGGLAPLIYICGWVHANVILSQYKRLARERVEQLDLHGGGVDSQLEKGLLLYKVLEAKEEGRLILHEAVEQPGSSDALVSKAKAILAKG